MRNPLGLHIEPYNQVFSFQEGIQVDHFLKGPVYNKAVVLSRGLSERDPRCCRALFSPFKGHLVVDQGKPLDFQVEPSGTKRLLGAFLGGSGVVSLTIQRFLAEAVLEAKLFPGIVGTDTDFQTYWIRELTKPLNQGSRQPAVQPTNIFIWGEIYP